LEESWPDEMEVATKENEKEEEKIKQIVINSYFIGLII